MISQARSALQQQFATQNNAGNTRTCRATAAEHSRRPILSPQARLRRGISSDRFTKRAKAGSRLAIQDEDTIN
jgi:hypothetical protein